MAEWKDKNGVLCIGLRVDPKTNKANKGDKKPEQPKQGEAHEQGGNKNE